MRVIRTEFYFDATYIKSSILDSATPINPGVSVAWLSTDRDITIYDLISALRESTVALERGPAIQLSREFLDFALQGAENDFPTISGPLKTLENRVVVEAVMQGSVVIERSPPTALSLESLLRKSPGIAIGAWVGYKAAGADPILMLATVPGGIIAVSSAIGLSKAIEAGLFKLADTIGRPPSRPRKRTR